MTREEAIKVLKDFCNGGWPSYYGFVSAVNVAIEALSADAEFKWCTDCKEYDQDRHCCHRCTKVIRNTVEELKEHYDGYVEVVRCKDCRYRYEEGDCTHYYWCRLNDRPIDDTDFCAWGERSEE